MPKYFLRKQYTKSELGMTLVEVMVAIAVLAIIVQVVLTTQLSAITTDINAQKRTQATFLCQAGMEKARNFSGMASLPALPYNLEENITFAEYPGFTRLTQFVTGGPAGLTKISVTVSWADAEGNPQSLTITSIRNN